MFPPSVNTQIDPSVLRYILSNDYLFFVLDPAVHPDGVIYPGEPVSFVWGVYSFFVGTGGEVPQFRDAQATITFDGNIIWPASQVRSGRIEPPAFPREFYRVGASNVLVMQVPPPGGGEPLTSSLVVDVVPETVDSTWFTWDPTPASALRWKQDSYTLGGSLVNRSEWSSMSFAPDLGEAPFLQEMSVTPARDLGLPQGSPFTIAHGGSVSFAWPPITQAWTPWFDRVLLLTDDQQQAKSFQYSISFVATDEYGNAYPPVTTVAVIVSVVVASWKVTDVVAAGGFQDAAVIMMIAAFAGGIATPWGIGFAAAAGISEGIAQGLATAANDPPEPDPDYQQAEQLVLPAPPGTLADVPELAPLAEILAQASLLTLGQGVLSRTHGRLLGALLAADTAGTARQADQYAAVMSQMAKAAVTLLDGVGQLPAVLAAAKIDVSQLPAALAGWQQDGLPAAATAALESAGLSGSDIATFSAAAASLDATKPPADLAGALATAAANLAQATLALRDEAPLVLALPAKLDAKKPLTLADLAVPALHAQLARPAAPSPAP
jgi:hypothetical protein